MSTNHRRDNALRHVSTGQWRRVVVQTARDLWSVNVLEWASSIAFYGFISTFPLIIAILIVVSAVADSSSVADHTTSILETFIPEGGPEAGNILESAVSERRRIGLLSLLIFFVSGRRVLGVLTKALNQVSDVHRRDDSLVRRVVVELALLVGLVIFGLLALLARPLLNLLWDTARFVPGPDAPAVQAMALVLRVIPVMATFGLVYAFVPYGERLWRAVLVGAGAATVLLLLVRQIFDVFADRIWSNMGLLYGPLALAAVLLSWIWCVAVITLVGGGFASHVKMMILEQQSDEQTQQRHVGG
jgi:membrane protein